MNNRHTKMCVIVFTLMFIGVQLVSLQPLGATLPEVNDFDSVLMFPYAPSLSTVSDVTQYLAFFAPAVLAFAGDTSEWLELSLLFGTSAILSFGTRTLMKSMIYRPRPYRYFPDSPEHPPVWEDDHNQSFPSGHSIMAFTGAAFTHTMFALRYPESPLRLPVTISAWTFATATAVLRVASGNHFVTDVLAGAAIGTLFGSIVPLAAHRLIPAWRDRVGVALGPNSVSVEIRY